MYNIKGSGEVSELISGDVLKSSIMDLRLEDVKRRVPVDEIVKICDEIVKSPIPETPYRYFSEFYKSGNRTHYETLYSLKRCNMYFLSLGTFLTQNDKFLEKLNDYLWSICEESTWCLPAHVPEKLDFNEPYIDLFSSTTAEQLGEILDTLGNKLEDNIRNRIAFELKRRVFMPFVENPDKYWWANRFRSNWCAVCCGTIGSAAIMFKLKEPYLSRLLAEVIHRLNQYLDNFDDEGGWVEGVGYWNFGLTHLVRFADALCKITEGKLNLFEHPKLQAAGSFPVHCFLPPDGFVNFSDCAPGVELSADLIKSLAINTSRGAELSYLLEELPDFRLNRFGTLRNLKGWSLPETKMPDEPYRYFKGIGWIVTRKSWQDKLTAVLAVKAGNNGEPHNHIDVGQFIFHVFGEDFLCDLGSGIYDRAYFGESRYENPFCGADGHSLIFIDGKGEGIGEKFYGRIVEFKPEEKFDVVLLDLTRAYPSRLVDKVERKLTFLKNRSEGGLILEDEVKAKKKTSIESRLQIQGKPRVIADKEVILKGHLGNVCIKVEEPENVHIRIGELRNLKAREGRRAAKYLSILADDVSDIKFVVKVLPFRDTKELK